MSKTIDERVVEMRFDNKQFESNVATSMSTLDKLKQKLNLSGASKGLEDIDAASKKINMTGLGGAVDTVKAKFSALDVVAVTALANITNQAVNAGKRLIASLSIDQVTAGWQKYSDKTTSVATLVAQGNAIEDVNEQLDRLNWFTDETSYNFTEMVSNIAKFTATGKGLNESVTAMEGIANWAALSGQNAATASRAMYQLSQAMGAGVMRLEDYKSIQNASMDTEEFRQKCLDAAVSLKTLKDNGDGTYSSLVAGASDTSFNISQFARNLTDGMWLTSDVMMKVFTDYSQAVNAIYEVTEEKGMLASEVIDEVHEKANQIKKDGMTDEEAINSAIKELGYTLEDGSLMFDAFGLKAFESAQKARTFRDAIDSVKDAVSTGWMNTFEIIFGDAEKATELWTDLANALWDIFAAGGEVRNTILEFALNFKKPWASISEKLGFTEIEKIKNITDSLEEINGKVKTAIGTLEYWQDIVNKVWRGDYNNHDANPAIDRFNLLEKAGYDHRIVQDLVNKGYQYKLTMEDVEESYRKFGIAIENTSAGKVAEIADTFESVGDKVQDATEIVKYWQDIVNKVWRGDYNNHDINPEIDRFTLLENAGYDHRVVQDLVNKGYQYEITIEDIEASHRKFGLTMGTTTTEIKKNAEATETATEAFIELTDEQLRQAGLTEDEISLYRALEKEAKRLGISVSQLAEEMSTNDGRTLLIEAFKNFANVLIGTGNAIKEAWSDIFNPPGVGEMAVKLYGAIKSLNQFSEKVRLTDKETGELNENGKKLKRTFKGIFAIVDILRTVLGGGLRIAFKVISSILEHFNLNILDVTAAIGDVLVKFRDWLLEGNALAKGFNWLISKIPIIVEKFRDWFNVFKQTPAVQKFVDAINAIKTAFSKLTSGEISISEFAASLGENLAKALKSLPGIALQIGKDFIAGFKNGIGDSIGGIIRNVVNFCIEFVSSFAAALGVHSPSWKAYDIASDFFQGFINGAKKIFGAVVTVLKTIGEGIVKVFKSFWDFLTDESGNIEWGKLFAGGIIVAMVFLLKKIAMAFSTLAGAIGGIEAMLFSTAKAMRGFAKVLNGIAWDLKAKALLKMAIAIGVLVAAIWVLTQIDDAKKLWNAVGVIAVLALILLALAISMNKLSTASLMVNKNGASLNGLKSGLLQIGIAIFLLAATVKMIGDMDQEKAKQGFKGLAAIAVGMIVFLAAIGGVSRYSKDVGGIGSMMKKLAIAMILMVVACKLASKLSGEEMLKGAAFAAGFAIFVIAITRVAKSSGNNVSKVGGMILKLSIAMLLMIGVCKLAGMLSAKEMLKGAAFATGFVIFVAALVGVTKIGKKQQLAKVSGLVLSVSFSMLLLVGICKLVGMLSAEEMIKGAAFVTGFVVLLKVLMSILKIGNEEKIAKVTGTILAMATAIAILAGVSVLLSFMDLGSLAKGITAVGLLSLMMTIMVKSLKGAQNAKGAIMMMAIAIAVMAGAVVALSFIDTKSLISAAGAMSIMMATFALMTKSMKGLGKQKIPVAPIIALSGVILILAGIIYLLKDVEPSSAIGAAGALALLLLSMAVVVRIVSAVGSSVSGAVKGILSLTLMAIPLLAFVGVLALMSGVNNAMSNIKALTLLAGALTLMLIPLTIVGMFAVNALLGVLALTAMAIPLLAFVGILALMSGVNNATANAELLSNFMTAMADVLFKISLVAPLALVADVAITGLIAVIGVVGVLAVAIGALMEKVPSIQEFLNTGLPVLEQLSGSIGTMIGNFVGGIISGIGNAILDLLPRLGVALSEFMVGARDFISIARTVDSSVVEGAAYMTAAILMLTVADFLAGIAQFLNCGVSFSDLGTQLMLFGTGAVAFFNLIKGVDSEAVEAASSVANMILALSVSELISAIADFLGGDTDFSTLGEDLKTFGEAVVGFSDTITGKVDTASVEAAASAGMMLAELNKSLSRSGGLLQDIFGEQDFGKFSESCKAFADCMIDINEMLSQEGFKIESGKFEQLTTAGDQFSELLNSLPKSNGLLQELLGEEDFGKFGESCKEFAKCMIEVNSSLAQEGFKIESEKFEQLTTAGTQFSELLNSLPKSNGLLQELLGEEELGDFGESCAAFANCMIKVNDAVSKEGFAFNLEAIDAMKQAGDKMNELQDSLPKTGGWWQDIAGSQDIGDFGEKVAAFGEAMAGFSESAKGVDSAAIDVVMGAAHRMKNLMLELVDIDTDGFDDFIDDVVEELGEAMADFSDEVEDIDVDAVSVSVTAAQKLRSLIANLVNLDTSGIENFNPQPIGTQMKGYAEKVKGMDTGVVESSAASAIRLKNLITSLSTLDPSGVHNFKPGPIATSLKSYSNSITGINFNVVLSSLTTASKIKSFISSLAGFNSSGATSFKNAIDQLSTVNIDGFVKAFSGSYTKLSSAGANMIDGLIKGMRSKLPLVKNVVTTILLGISNGISSKISLFEKAGSTIIVRLAEGLSSKKKAISSAVTSCLSSAVTSIRSKYTSFYNAGSYLVTGFCNGISENSYKAAAKAKAMAEAAVKAAREALDINSPSKVFKEIGSGIPEGFAMGIGMLGNKVDASVTKMASSAINSGKKAMSIVLDALNIDIDSQPTIRPVIDLTDVKTGASAINGMFNGGQTIGVRSNLGAISSTMNSKLQNGSNDDIISAINKLNDNLESNRGDTYHFGNFTYDDGSNINDAVQTLVRAAIMGRRV